MEAVNKFLLLSSAKMTMDQLGVGGLAAFIKTINSKLDDEGLGMNIVKALDEEPLGRRNFYVFVNTLDRSTDANQITRRAMFDFQPHEVQYLKLLTEAIVESEERQIGKINALNVAKGVKQRTVKTTDAEAILRRLHEQKWLTEIEDQRGHVSYILSTRFIAEMEPYLKATYGDRLTKCGSKTCGKLVLRGVRCEHCEVVFHRYCVLAGAKKGASEGVPCPECKTEIDLEGGGGFSQASSARAKRKMPRVQYKSKKRQQQEESSEEEGSDD